MTDGCGVGARAIGGRDIMAAMRTSMRRKDALESEMS